jgi:hypothetical protein
MKIVFIEPTLCVPTPRATRVVRVRLISFFTFRYCSLPSLGQRSLVRRRKEPDSQIGLPSSRSPSRGRTLEVRCGNCQGCFVAWYGTEEDAHTEATEVEKVGL